MEEKVKLAKEMTIGLLERMDLKTEVEGFFKEGSLYLEIRGDREGFIIGKHGRTLDSLQFLINRMVNKQLKEPIKIDLDVNNYKARRSDSLKKMATRLGERAKRIGKSIIIGPFNAHDRRIIHMALKDESSLKTESFGEGEMKKIRISPKKI